MIYVLTIILTIVILWSFISLSVLIAYCDMNCYDPMTLNLKENGLLVTLAQLYWLSILVILSISILVFISYKISQKIICNVINNDDIVCVKQQTK